MLMENFADVYKKLKESVAFQNFSQEDYVLAHGFVQLDEQGNSSKPWHIGYYSPSKDNLAIFSAPSFTLTFDQAFKDGGTISELKYLDSFQSTDDIIQVVRDRVQEAYPRELPYTYIVILQMVEQQPRYNITYISKSFKMLNFQIDPLSGAIMKEQVSSVMDLKASQDQ